MTFEIKTDIEYDRDRGVLSIIDQFVREEIMVRAGMVDKVIRQACIIELERLGYTVIPPAGAER